MLLQTMMGYDRHGVLYVCRGIKVVKNVCLLITSVIIKEKNKLANKKRQRNNTLMNHTTYASSNNCELCINRLEVMMAMTWIWSSFSRIALARL